MHVCQVTQACLTLCDLMDCSLPGSSAHGSLLQYSPGLSKNTGVGCHTLFQGFLPTQGSNPHLFSCTGRWVLYL